MNKIKWNEMPAGQIRRKCQRAAQTSHCGE